MLIKKIFTCLMIAAAISTSANAQNIIRTVLGNGTGTDTGDGGLASAATINQPQAIVINTAGDIFIAERFGTRIRKITKSTGKVSTLVGGSSRILGLAFDENGNLFASTNQHVIERFNSSTGVSMGVIAGTSGTTGYSTSGTASTALLNNPFGMAYDKIGKLLYIAQQGNKVISKIDFNPTTPTISIFAGDKNATNQYFLDPNSAPNTTTSQPSSVAIDPSGNIYWSGFSVNTVFKSNPAGTVVSAVVSGPGNAALNTGDGGLATAARMADINTGGLAFDAAGDLYIADNTFHRVRKVNLSSDGKINNYAGYTSYVNGTTTPAATGNPAPGDGADPSNPSGDILNGTVGIAFDALGNLFISENSNRIRAVGTVANLNTALPLDLTSFDAKAVNETTVLKWTTENEVNFKEFIVGRKGDNDANFTTIKTIATKNLKTTSLYSFTDVNPLKGNNYYQLKMVDNDGTFKVSEVKAVKFNSLAVSELSIYPNPVQNTLNLNHAEAGLNASISIYGIDGKLINNKTVTSSSTQTTIDVSSLKTGQYILKFNNNGTQQAVKFIK